MSLSPKDAYWAQFLNSLPAQQTAPHCCGTICFGDGQEAEAIGGLALEGIKTATGSLLWQYEYDRQPLPQPGDHNILVNADDHPMAILQTTRNSDRPFR